MDLIERIEAMLLRVWGISLRCKIICTEWHSEDYNFVTCNSLDKTVKTLLIDGVFNCFFCKEI